jgi:predicted TPR repeat methyltransferase
MPIRQQLLRKLASISAVANAWNFAFALRDELRPRSQSRYAESFAARADPWGYEVKPFEFEKFQAANELLDGVRNGAYFERAWEIGCAEGVMTERLAQRCERLSAVDFMPLALQRARMRCLGFSNISFSQWDLRFDSAPGTFDLIVIMDVLGSFFGRRSDIRRARDKVVSALAPDGYLLYSDCLDQLHKRPIYDSWWGRFLLVRARNIYRFVAAHPALVKVASRETEMHLLALFQKRQ